ncbi:RING finger protein 212B isoform X2 [Rissa tridactyla]|uniref:RING finger protein 212B isoform X2 n=1 Tax=Rissa tridactyla TaxID=75485 RepID=UPI0023BA603F|nr:RING finger protein 212B isoform X2 [Rissa tridactyla]
MDWFHCNRCFRQEGAGFAVTSCGHVLCAACGGAGPCPVCAAECRYLPISDKMRPQEKLFFKSPADIALRRLAQLSQAWRFQRAQAELLLARHREAARSAQAALEETRHLLEARHRSPQAGAGAAGETHPPRSPLCRGVSGDHRHHPALAPRRSSTPRPVGVTSPAQTVTPQPRRQLSGQVVR